MTVAACDHAPSPGKAKPEGSPQAAASPRPTAASAPPLPDFAVDAVRTQEGNAIWYDVPEQSLPERKAWTQEMTAASDALPQNGYVRVRRLDGKGQPVILRITDSGLHHKDALIDVSHAAAEALDIIKSGEARVRVETLALKNASADKPVDKKNAPAAPKITDTPAASQQAEKDAASAKGGS